MNNLLYLVFILKVVEYVFSEFQYFIFSVHFAVKCGAIFYQKHDVFTDLDMQRNECRTAQKIIKKSLSIEIREFCRMSRSVNTSPKSVPYKEPQRCLG